MKFVRFSCKKIFTSLCILKKAHLSLFFVVFLAFVCDSANAGRVTRWDKNGTTINFQNLGLQVTQTDENTNRIALIFFLNGGGGLGYKAL